LVGSDAGAFPELGFTSWAVDFREAIRDWLAVICPAAELSYIAQVGYGWEVLGQNLAGKGIDFREGYGLNPGALGTKGKSPYPGEQIKVG